MDHRRLCARPGCQAVASAWLTYDYAGQRVWIDDDHSGGGDRWALCDGHASRLTAPQGWTRIDRRVGLPGLVGAPARLVS